MTHLNKKRAGDENIGKLIMFSITIIIAVGLVGLITFFYNQSRENAVAGSVLGSSASSVSEIDEVIENLTGVAGACEVDASTTFEYNAISGVYTIDGTQAACGTELVKNDFAKVIDYDSTSTATKVMYKMK